MVIGFNIGEFIIGMFFLLIVWQVFEFIKRKIDIECKVGETVTNIHSNALWDYHNRNEEPQERKETFEDKLEEETKDYYFQESTNKTR